MTLQRMATFGRNILLKTEIQQDFWLGIKKVSGCLLVLFDGKDFVKAYKAFSPAPMQWFLPDAS